ncbi:actin interacting protein 3-domain-containing protein [Pilobolus umbonatus]|nr:actin interacting protein 3-domain-containing protein [Pilobolus umbonatus]
MHIPSNDILLLPDQLHSSIQSMVSHTPSHSILEHYLPDIRDTILALLQGLKMKQALIRTIQSPLTPTSPHLPQMTVIYLRKGERVKKVKCLNRFNRSYVCKLFQDHFNTTLNEPIICLLDPHSNVEYEIEDYTDIKEHDVVSMREEQSPLISQLKQVLDKWMNSHQITSPQPPLELTSLRHDVDEIRGLNQTLKTQFTDIIQEIRHRASTVGVRSRMEDSKERTQKAATFITHRLESLQDTIDQLKSDVTQKRCRPSKSRLSYCQQESKKLEAELTELADHIKSCKPTWKKTWETELQHIVKEQQFLKEQEALLVDLKEDHHAALEVLSQLITISNLQEKHPRPIITQISSDGMSGILTQVANLEIDHHKRLKAVEKAEQSRSRDLLLRRDDFEKELSDFVMLDKLKKTGNLFLNEKRHEARLKLMLQRDGATMPTNDHL